MDSTESARQIAAAIHAELIGLGHDPWQSFQFVSAEVSRRDFDAEPVQKGSAMLRGSRASLAADDNLILYESCGTPFDHAFLIAHELGHLSLGDAEGNAPAPHTIDPARSSEAAPDGIDRIIDYSARQRREIQMDLFGRELLLPRAWLRQLHLEQGLSASAIAKRLGAPFDVVGQQLLDALLLPPVELEGPVGERVELPLNPLQRRAAEHRGKPYILEAGPGTGKTQTLVRRIDGLLKEGVDPRRILVLTFSNKAAGELSDRLAALDKGAAAAMWIGTFHAFGLDVVKRFHTEFGFTCEPRLMDRTETVELYEERFPHLRLEHYQNVYDPTEKVVDLMAAVSRAKDEVVDASAYAQLAAAMQEKATTTDELIAAEKAQEVAVFYADYEATKLSENGIDFGDLVMLPVQLLERDLTIRSHFRSLYDHVLVDEYQDVNRSSVRLLLALCGQGDNLWVVGDVKQSIYRFRGASSFNMERFRTSDFTDGTEGHLESNYRSYQEIVDAYSAFAVGMAVNTGSRPLTAERGEGDFKPGFRKSLKAPDQTVAIADAIEEMRAAGYAYRDQAILCSGNDRLAALAEELERLNIPVLFLGSLFERPEVKDVLSLLSILVDPRAMGLVRVASLPEFMLTMEDLTVVLRYLRDHADALNDWLTRIPEIDGLTRAGVAALTALRTALEEFSASSAPWNIVASILLDRTRIAARLATSASVADRTRCIAIWQLMNFMRAVQPAQKGLPVPRMLDRVRRLLRLGDDKDLRQLPEAAQNIDAVRLMTMHGAKGLEFKVVHIPGMNQNTLPRAAQPSSCPPPPGMVEGAGADGVEFAKAEHAKEQECLFYVAISRAKDRLLMYAPTKNANNASRPISSFVSRIGTLIDMTDVQPSCALPVAAEDADIEIVIETGVSFEASQISLYDSCPRRFFYTHILQIGGRRTRTALSLLHDAVRAVYQDHIKQGATDHNALGNKAVAALKEHGLEGHGYLPEYEELARNMAEFFASSRAGMVSEAPTPIVLKVGDEQVVIRPDDVLKSSDGTKRLRRIKTGHSRSKEDKQIDTAAFVLAAQRAFPGAKVELVHLADQTITEPSLSAKELKNREDKLSSVMQAIRNGQFPTESSRFSCPACPAFFICGPVPKGILNKSSN